jgi:hypothetical protein
MAWGLLSTREKEAGVIQHEQWVAALIILRGLKRENGICRLSCQ